MTGGPVLEVLQPGLLTTVQDAGRPGHRDEGVPVAGACDPVGLAIANLLAGNDPGEAALECTVVGPDLWILRDTVIGLGGADLGAVVQPGGRRLAAGQSHRLAAGERIALPGVASGGSGCRAYVAIPGGFDVPVVLGSRSTSLVGGFGGLDGRPLRVGDRLGARGHDRAVAETVGAGAQPGLRWPLEPAVPAPGRPVRVLALPGGLPDAGQVISTLVQTAWTVAPASDRRGMRLDGRRLDALVTADRPSQGVVPGTIQLTPSGQPLVLLADAGTTGGYPVIGVVVTADLAILGQTPPGATVRFQLSDQDEARRAAAEQRAMLEAGAARLRALAGDAWDDLAHLAGA